MTMTFEQLLVFFTALVSLFSPLANIGPFAGLVGHFPRDEQKKIARGVFINTIVVLLILVWAGEVIFQVLGVTPHALSLVGGIALFRAGMPMMSNGTKEDANVDEVDAKRQDWRSMVAVPMTFPMSIGGTTAAYVVSGTAFARNAADLAAISVVIVLFAVVIWLTHYFSPPLTSRLSPAGRDIVTRVGGIILLAIALGLMANGLKGFFPGLA